MKIAGNDYELIYSELKSIFLKRKFMNYYKSSDDDEIKEIVNFLKNKIKLELFPYKFTSKYKKEDIIVKSENNNRFIEHNGKKLFFSKKYKNEYRCKRYYNNLKIEQDINSPHRYLTQNFTIEKDSVVLDLGGAEGIFSLDALDIAEKIYIFECNKDWIDALNCTFKDYKKVQIINKFVSNKDTNDSITLDTFIEEQNLSNKKIFIKMDIEGNEEKALEGFKNNIKKLQNLKMVICTYHTQDAEKNIKNKFLKDFKTEISNGYMIYYYDYDLKEPYLRRGLIRAQKNN